MAVCIHGNVCEALYNKTKRILSISCPNGCKFFEEKYQNGKKQNMNSIMKNSNIKIVIDDGRRTE